MKISIVTVCKGRLHHLRQTAPLIAAQQPDEHIIVDYDCQDHCGDWVERNLPSASVVRATDPRGFCLSRGRNLGATAATGDFIFFMDADILIEPGLIDWIRANVQPDGFYISPHFPEGARSETEGSFVCARPLFESVGGYDEAIRTWGREDSDLYMRLQEVAAYRRLPAGTVTAIRHDNAERTLEYDSGPLDAVLARTALYVRIKHEAGRHVPIQHRLCCREALFAQTAGDFGRKSAFGRQSRTARFRLRCEECVGRGETQRFFNMQWVRRYRFFGPKVLKTWMD